MPSPQLNDTPRPTVEYYIRGLNRETGTVVETRRWMRRVSSLVHSQRRTYFHVVGRVVSCSGGRGVAAADLAEPPPEPPP